MRLQTLSTSAAVALLVGLAQHFVLLFCWAYIAAYSPLPRWLVELGLRGSAFRAILLPADFITSVVISLPAAYALLKLRPNKLWLYLLFAVIPSFVWQNFGLIGDPMLGQFPGMIALDWAAELFALPVAALILGFALNRGASNNSFKPKPLRGSA
ncbi:hypothetical protein [Lysobacter sp. P5_B9]